MSIAWEKFEVSQPIGSKTVVDADGKKKQQKTYRKVVLVHPVLSPDTLASPDAIALALVEIASEERAGYLTVHQLGEYLNYGLKYGPASQIRTGNDFKYTQVQRESIKAFVGLIQNGFMTEEMALDALLRQGVPEAAEALSAYLRPAESSEEDAEGSEA